MTGFLSKTAQAGDSAQWSAFAEASAEIALNMRAQPEKWYSAQAESLSSTWRQTGLPTPQLEDWKYTNLAPLHEKKRAIVVGSPEVVVPDGIRVLKLSQLAATKSVSPLEILDVRSLLEQNGNVFFENLAKSVVADPIVILVPPGFKSVTPIEIFWEGLSGAKWAFGVAALIIGEGAEISLIEKYGVDVDAQTQATVILLRAKSKVSHLRMQTGGGGSEDSFVLSSARARVLNNATYETAQVSFGSRLSREDLTVELFEPGADVVTDGVFIGRAGQLLDHHTNLVHRVGNTTSRQIYKGILSDESRGVFNGRIAIEKNASGSNSSQMNKNLLLSKKVELDTKPQLEIDNDDVKAAHGAAVGRLDAEHIFYLRSRGIEMHQAVGMLARGFAGEAVQRLSSSTLRKVGTTEIERGLAGLRWEAM